MSNTLLIQQINKIDATLFASFVNASTATELDPEFQGLLCSMINSLREKLVSLKPKPEIVANKAKGLADKIERVMKEKGLNRSALAVLLSTQPSAITKYLSGTHNFTLETLLDIEEKLQCTLINVE